MLREYSEALHLFTLVVADTERLDILCENPNSCPQGPGGGLVVAPAEKTLLLGSQFDCKPWHEQILHPLSCFPKSRYNYLSFWTPVLLHLLFDLHTYMGVLILLCYKHYIWYKNYFIVILATKLIILFHKLIRLWLFLKYWWSAIVMAISKDAPSNAIPPYQ